MIEVDSAHVSFRLEGMNQINFPALLARRRLIGKNIAAGIDQKRPKPLQPVGGTVNRPAFTHTP